MLFFKFVGINGKYNTPDTSSSSSPNTDLDDESESQPQDVTQILPVTSFENDDSIASQVRSVTSSEIDDTCTSNKTPSTPDITQKSKATNTGSTLIRLLVMICRKLCCIFCRCEL